MLGPMHRGRQLQYHRMGLVHNSSRQCVAKPVSSKATGSWKAWPRYAEQETPGTPPQGALFARSLPEPVPTWVDTKFFVTFDTILLLYSVKTPEGDLQEREQQLKRPFICVLSGSLSVERRPLLMVIKA